MQDYNKDMEAKTNKQVEVLLEIFVVSTTEIDESLSITNEAWYLETVINSAK